MARVKVGRITGENGERGFVDANFLIAFAASSEHNHLAAKVVMAQLINLRRQEQVQLHLSPMVLNEAWWGLCKVQYEAQVGRPGSWGPVGKPDKLREFAARVNDICADHDYWMNKVGLRVLSVGEEDVPAAIANLRQYPQLEPTDAFHLAVMQREGSTAIVSNDSGFEGIEGLTRVSFHV